MDIEYGDYKVEARVTNPDGSRVTEFTSYREDIVKALIVSVGMSGVMEDGCQMIITVTPNSAEEITPEDILGVGC